MIAAVNKRLMGCDDNFSQQNGEIGTSFLYCGCVNDSFGIYATQHKLLFNKSF